MKWGGLSKSGCSEGLFGTFSGGYWGIDGAEGAGFRVKGAGF